MRSLRASQAAAFFRSARQQYAPRVKANSTSTPIRPQSTFTRPTLRLRSARQPPRARQYSSRPSPDVTANLGSPPAKLGMRERFKRLGKEYGYLSVAVYLTFSALDFPFCFLAVRLAGPERIGHLEHAILSKLKVVSEPVWNVIGPVVGPVVDAIGEVVSRIRKGAVKTAGVGGEAVEHVHSQKASGSASIWTQLALAYGIHKTLLIFVRVPLTIAFTPRIARALRARGWKIGSQA